MPSSDKKKLEALIRDQAWRPITASEDLPVFEQGFLPFHPLVRLWNGNRWHTLPGRCVLRALHPWREFTQVWPSDAGFANRLGYFGR
jgi:hypothetical protein